MEGKHLVWGNGLELLWLRIGVVSSLCENGSVAAGECPSCG